MIKVVELRVGRAGKVEEFQCPEELLQVGDLCVLMYDRGYHYGTVLSDPRIIERKCDTKGLAKIIRLANDRDLETLKKNAVDAVALKATCRSKIKAYALDMKVVDLEYSFDRSKVICYFASEGRVDFRSLVKELASVFRSRIELRQIGARDEARLIGGQGSCGRELCCTSHLRAFNSVSIQMAKVQQVSVTPDQISGVCGRLMCCLAYEYDQYKMLAKNLPPKGSRVVIDEGEGRVKDVYILKQTLLVELDNTYERIEVNPARVRQIFKSKKKNKKEVKI